MSNEHQLKKNFLDASVRREEAVKKINLLETKSIIFVSRNLQEDTEITTGF